MLEVVQKVSSHRFVDNFLIERLIDDASVKFVRLVVRFKNKTQLHVRHFSSSFEIKYSYHWQTANGTLIGRWDNAPHGKKSRRYFDHFHDGAKVIPGKPVSIEEVLKYIQKQSEA